MKYRSGLVASMLGVAALWFVPAASAQILVTSVKVTESSANNVNGKIAVWCNVSAACAAIPNAIQVWNLGGGVSVGVGQTLVLAPTGIVFNQTFTGGNFDTSDRANLQLPNEAACSVADPCNVAIEINGTQVYSSSAGDALDYFNSDFPGNNSVNEASQWSLPVFSTTNYSLSLGYADNQHGTTCPALGCFPHPFADATYFLGAGAVQALGDCPANNVPTGCFDGGALLITGLQPPQAGCTLTQGGYKNHFNSLVLNLPTPNLLLGSVPYTNLQINSILQNNAVKGNGLLSLAHQLITAKLNIRYGASAPLAVEAAIVAADALIGGLVFPPVGSRYLAPASTSVLTGILDDFNNGLTGPGHCN